ncbi:MAG: AbrB/MazE/SpoVT family DNA-binding domain-containing protein [Euryarchaeota archaeon]|nr:AbrB/MazE/SpoVT family DNA-binding domain-containing protein [Euryarchaeota archaeon]
MATTKVSKKYLTSVPSEIRKIFGLEVGDELEWLPMGAEIVVKLKRKKIKKDPLLQMVGLVEADPSDVTKNHNKILYGRG